MGIRIITDSTSDISLEDAKKLDINIVPLKVIFGDREYKEGIEITLDGFYKKLVESEKLPTTSQPSPEDFLVHFKEAKQAGDSVIVLLIAGKLSGTLQSAMIAKDMLDDSDIYIIDSLNATLGLRLLVEQAVKMRNSGHTVTEIVTELEILKERIVFLAVVDTLEYLHKGGRLSRSSAILGTLLKFKPVLHLKDGVIGVVGKERGTNKAINFVLEQMKELGEVDENYPLVLGFTAEDSKCLMLKEKLMDKYPMINPPLYPVGCVVGTHLGPGGSLLSYIRKK